MSVTDVQGPETLTLTVTPSSTHRRSASGSCGPIRASSSAGGARQLRRPSPGPPDPPSRVEYHMTGPDGEQYGGYWRPSRLTRPTGPSSARVSANGDGTPNNDLPLDSARAASALMRSTAGSTRMSIDIVFPSAEAMEQVLAMGTQEGMTFPLARSMRSWPRTPSPATAPGA